MYLKKRTITTEHRSQTARRRFFFSMFQIYILFVQDGDRRRRKGSTFKKRFQSKRGRTLLRLFSFLHVFFFFFYFSWSIIPSHVKPPERVDYKQTNSRFDSRPPKHLSCSRLTFIVFQPSAKKRHRVDRWRTRRRKWRRRRRDEWLKQERKNTTVPPARPPSKHALIHPLHRGM